jgi:hypothetical protein
MVKYYIILIGIILSVSVYSQNYFYDDISSIEHQYIERGFGLPFKSFPYSEKELFYYLDKLDTGTQSSTEKLSLQSYYSNLQKDYMYVDPDGFFFDAGVEYVMEGFYHWNINNNFDFSPRDYIWQHGYEERQPMLNIPFEAKILDLLYVKTELTAKEEHMTVNSPTEDTASDNHFNLLDFNNPQIDLYFPFQALASLSDNHWNIQLGRDNLSWGNGQTGNLVLSDYSDFYDYLLVNTFWDNFKFSTVYAVMDEYSPRDVEGDEDIEGNPLPDGKLDNITYYAFIGHRLDMRFFNRLNVALNEVVTYSDYYPSLIKDLNSLMIYHNWTIPGKTNSMLSAEFEYIPWKYFYFYGQIAMDEFTTTYEEEGNGGGGNPTWGWLGGIKGGTFIGPGYLSANLEYVYTDPLLYHRRASPYYYNVRKIWSLVTDSYEFITKPIGHKIGPDAILWHFNIGYEWFPNLKSQLELDYLRMGETTIADDYSRTSETVTPTGIVESIFVIHLDLESQITDYLSAGLDLYYINTSNYGHTENLNTNDLEIASHIKFKY